MAGKLYFTIGMQRSGKSTYCTKWASEKVGRVIVSSDDIRMALYGRRYCKYAETMVFAIKHVMVRAHLSRGFDVIVDGTHSTAISIQRLLEIDRKATPIRIDTPMSTCIERAIATDQKDLIGPIQRVNRQIQQIDKVGIHSYLANIISTIDERGLFLDTAIINNAPSDETNH